MAGLFHAYCNKFDIANSSGAYDSSFKLAMISLAKAYLLDILSLNKRTLLSQKSYINMDAPFL